MCGMSRFVRLTPRCKYAIIGEACVARLWQCRDCITPASRPPGAIARVLPSEWPIPREADRFRFFKGERSTVNSRQLTFVGRQGLVFVVN